MVLVEGLIGHCVRFAIAKESETIAKDFREAVLQGCFAFRCVSEGFREFRWGDPCGQRRVSQEGDDK